MSWWSPSVPLSSYCSDTLRDPWLSRKEQWEAADPHLYSMWRLQKQVKRWRAREELKQCSSAAHPRARGFRSMFPFHMWPSSRTISRLVSTAADYQQVSCDHTGGDGGWQEQKGGDTAHTSSFDSTGPRPMCTDCSAAAPFEIKTATCRAREMDTQSDSEDGNRENGIHAYVALAEKETSPLRRTHPCAVHSVSSATTVAGDLSSGLTVRNLERLLNTLRVSSSTDHEASKGSGGTTRQADRVDPCDGHEASSSSITTNESAHLSSCDSSFSSSEGLPHFSTGGEDTWRFFLPPEDVMAYDPPEEVLFEHSDGQGAAALQRDGDGSESVSGSVRTGNCKQVPPTVRLRRKWTARPTSESVCGSVCTGKEHHDDMKENSVHVAQSRLGGLNGRKTAGEEHPCIDTSPVVEPDAISRGDGRCFQEPGSLTSTLAAGNGASEPSTSPHGGETTPVSRALSALDAGAVSLQMSPHSNRLILTNRDDVPEEIFDEMFLRYFGS